MFLFPKARGLERISYREALLSTLLHATVYMFLHNLLNVLVQTANKTVLQKTLFLSAYQSPFFNRFIKFP
jgi:hypothetical protein